MADNKGMRIDRWLWSVRIFKSRTKATTACKSGRIRIGDIVVKPSTLVRVEDKLYIKKDGFNLTFLVKELIPKRVSATLAAPCYDNLTPVEELSKFKDWFIGKAAPERRERGAGRPTKRERRDIDVYKDELFLDQWLDSEEE